MSVFAGNHLYLILVASYNGFAHQMDSLMQHYIFMSNNAMMT